MFDSTEAVIQLISRYEKLEVCRQEIIAAYQMLREAYDGGHKLLVAGNGGSAADAEHIVGELMKSFRGKRTLPKSLVEELKRTDEKYGELLAASLEYPLTAIALTGHNALSTAYINDVGASTVVAQQLLGYGRTGDVFLGISTSGNSENIILAALTAKAMGIKVIGLTGGDGGRLRDLSDVLVCVPEVETYAIQELHLPIYHWWCMALEEYFFGEEPRIVKCR